MLRSLAIRDIVLVDRLDLEFGPGLTVLTGETGAGKSILLDALGLAVGSRADAALVRHGADQAMATAEFDLGPGHPARQVLAEQGIDGDGPLLLRRQLGRDGRSRAFINDQPVSVGLLRAVGDTLVEIEGQFEQHRLLDPATHRPLLDAAGALQPAAAEVAAHWRQWRQCRLTLEAAEEEIARLARDEAFLRHTTDELDAFDPKPGEDAELAEARVRFRHREALAEAAGAALGEIDGERGASSAIAAAQRRLTRVSDRGGAPVIAAIAALDRAMAEIDDAAAGLRRFADELDADPKRLNDIEERLFRLRELARKHAVAPDDLPAVRARLRGEIDALSDRGGRLASLAREADGARGAYVAAAERLDEGRVKAAARLDAAVKSELPPLKLERARFGTRIDRLPESEWGEGGIGRVVFEASTNPGTPAGPLARIASGGELVRFMLALKVVLAKADPVPTLVFDEVDTGIGGATAAAVGERLARLAKNLQILAVTHSPQVAAIADFHWRVVKANAKGAVLTKVEALTKESRREEIARMLSGALVTEEARAAAARLIAGAR